MPFLSVSPDQQCHSIEQLSRTTFGFCFTDLYDLYSYITPGQTWWVSKGLRSRTLGIAEATDSIKALKWLKTLK